MEKSLLWEAFSSLNGYELREFGKFVRSPFFTPRPQAAALCDYLHECREQKKSPEAASAFESAYPGEAYDDQRLRLLMSHTLSLLEHFWAYREHFPEPGSDKISIAAAYRKRNLSKPFLIALREARAHLERQTQRPADYYHNLNLLAWEQYQFDAADKRTTSHNLQENTDLIDLAFMARKLRLACAVRSHQAVYKTEYDLGLLPEIMVHAENRNLLVLPAIGLYYYCIKFFDEPAAASEHFTRFRNMLAEQADALPPDEMRALYLIAINFGIKKINESQEGWMQATLDLYRGALTRELLLENGVLSRFAFNNIVAISLRVGDVAWAQDFILKYKNLLERQYREATAGLNLARVAYAQKDYATALSHLQRADYKDLMNNLTAKTLQLKIYYETDAYDLLASHLSSMKNFIRRHTAIGYHRTNYSRVVYFTQKLMEINLKDAKAVGLLRDQIATEKILTEKEWLLEMLA